MGKLVLSFTDIVGDEEEFFRTYFNKRVLYRPRGITGDPRQILSIADMDDIVHQEGMRSSLLRMLGNGVPAIGDQLTAQLEMRREGKTIDDAIDPGRIYAHFRAGKTLIHGGLNLTRPNLRALAASMTGRLAAKSEVVAFLTPAGQGGATHSDPTDVYVIQLEGTKRWQIWPAPQVRRPGEDKDSFPSLPDPVLDVSLQPGGVLYIPHSTPHRASAEGSVSLHVTVVAGPRTWAHPLLSAVQDILHNGPEFWDTPYLDDTSPEELTAKIDQLIGRLRAVDAAAVLERARRDGRSFRGVQQAALFQEMAAADDIDADTKLLAVAANRPAVHHEPAGDGAGRGGLATGRRARSGQQHGSQANDGLCSPHGILPRCCAPRLDGAAGITVPIERQPAAVADLADIKGEAARRR